MANERKSTFSLELKGNAAPVARDTADAVEQLAASIEKGEGNIKSMSSELRQLRGSSAEVKAAKDKLKAAIAGTRQEITRDALELRKLGTTTTDVAKRHKLLADEQKRATEALKRSTDDTKKRQASLKAAFSATGGPVASLSGKLGELDDITAGLSVAEGTLAVGTLAALAGVTALAGGVVYAGSKFLEFIVSTRSAAREMNLLRIAATGAEVNGENLGSQVTALARTVNVSRGEVNKLGIELARTGLRGQPLIDTMNAVEQATGVGDDALAGFAKDLVTRGQQFNRFSLSPQELLGKNLRFDDVAAELAKGMHTSIDDARQALVQGQVPLAEGAGALRRAMERKFAGVNKELLLDPSKQVEKFKENIQDLTSGVDIKPLLQDMHDFFDLFDPEKSKSGEAIKQLVTSLGSGLVEGIHGAAPAANDLIRNLVLGGLKVDNQWLTVKLTIKKAVEEAESAIDKIKNFRVEGVGDLLHLTGKVGNASVGNGPHQSTGGKLGSALSFGLLGPIGGAIGIYKAAGALADTASEGFKDSAEIHSPSKVFERHGQNIVKGVTGSLERGAPGVFDAMNVMLAPTLRALSPGAAAGTTLGSPARGPVSLSVTFQVGNERAARQLQAPSTQAQIKKMLAEVLLQAGFGVPA